MVDYTKMPDKKRLHVDPNPIKPEEKVEVKYVEEEVVEEPMNPMKEFFDDMEIIRTQALDPTIENKPSYDIGGPVFQNYLLWLQLSELMKMNKKLDEVLKRNAV